MYQDRHVEELCQEAQDAIQLIEETYKPQFDAWEPELEHWYRLPKTNEHDQHMIFDVIMETFVPHFELILKAGTAAVDAFFTVMPNWLVVKSFVKIFRQVKEQDPAVAQRWLNELSIPLDSAPVVPDSVKKLHRDVVERLTQEMYGTITASDD